MEAGPGPWETSVKSFSQEQPGDPKETRGGGWEPPGRSQSSATDKSQAKAEGVQLAFSGLVSHSPEALQGF